MDERKFFFINIKSSGKPELFMFNSYRNLRVRKGFFYLLNPVFGKIKDQHQPAYDHQQSAQWCDRP